MCWDGSGFRLCGSRRVPAVGAWRLALFATRAIRAGEELWFDYGDDYDFHVATPPPAQVGACLVNPPGIVEGKPGVLLEGSTPWPAEMMALEECLQAAVVQGFGEQSLKRGLGLNPLVFRNNSNPNQSDPPPLKLPKVWASNGFIFQTLTPPS